MTASEYFLVPIGPPHVSLAHLPWDRVHVSGLTVSTRPELELLP